MQTAYSDLATARRERLWNWGFWASIVAFEVFGLLLTHQS